MSCKIVDITRNKGETFVTSSANTGLSRREKQEAIIVNLCNNIGITRVAKRQDSRGNWFYCPDDYGMSYQSADNTIYELSFYIG